MDKLQKKMKGLKTFVLLYSSIAVVIGWGVSFFSLKFVKGDDTLLHMKFLKVSYFITEYRKTKTDLLHSSIVPKNEPFLVVLYKHLILIKRVFINMNIFKKISSLETNNKYMVV